MSATGEAGFTLLEMLVTLAITALIAGLGFPAMQRVVDHLTFARAVADTGASVRIARAMAIAGGGRIELSLGADGRLVAAGKVLGAPLPQGTSLSFAPASIAFFADGTAQSADIRLTAAHEQWRAHVDTNGLVS